MLRLPVEAFSAVFEKYPESLVRVVQVSPSWGEPWRRPLGWQGTIDGFLSPSRSSWCACSVSPSWLYTTTLG